MIAVIDTVPFTLHEEIIDPAGHYIILICDITSTKLTLLNAYVPNTHQIRFLNSLFRKIKKVQIRSLLICRDINTTANPHVDSTTTTSRHTPSLRKFLLDNDLFDVWHCHYANEKDYSYFSLLILSHKLLLGRQIVTAKGH